MSSKIQNDDDVEEAIPSGDEEHDDRLDEDLEALRRACILVGTNLNDIKMDNDSGNVKSRSPSASACDYTGGGDEEDEDLKLFRNIQNRFSSLTDSWEPLSLTPLCAIPLDFGNDEDDFETLCAVRRRFAAYDNKETPSFCKVFPDNTETRQSISDDSIHQSVSDDSSCCGFPKSAQMFMDAIKKNRAYQKLLRSKLAQIEARIEENKKLKERVKILRDFQVSCRKNTGKSLSLGKDPHIQLISAARSSCRDSKVNDKKVSAMRSGPVENSHVANYRMALANFPLLSKQKKWTDAEKENLMKGIKQQFQEMILQYSVDQFSGAEGSLGDGNNLDAILASIRDMEIAPERIREFLPKVNWDQLASLYVVGHTGAECEAQWLNNEDPLINHSTWTVEEDKKLLFIVQEKGMTNWFDIAVSLGKNRTPFQCLSRFQRSLNARIMRSEWTKEEDAQLCSAVEIYGEKDWQSVASTLEGRTGTQCSNRWKKSLHPDKMGRWTVDEIKRLKLAALLFGPKNWMKIARFVPGRTGPQCRDRWVNCEDSSLNMDKWTEEEDLRLKAATEEHGYCWAKVAKHLPSRTDNQCLRRWKVLFPDKVHLLQEYRRTQKAAIICNFVDRESERPALGPHDFVPLSMIRSLPEPENMNQSKKHKRKTREKVLPGMDKNTVPCNTSKRRRSTRSKEGMQISLEEDPRNGIEVEKSCGNDTIVTKRRTKSCLRKNSHTEPAQDDLASKFVSMPSTVTNGSSTDKKRNKKLLKSQPNRNMLVDINGNSQSHLMSHPERLEVGMTNVDCVQAFGRKGATSSEKNRAHEEHYGANIYNSGEEDSFLLSGSIPDFTKLANYHLDSNLSVITNEQDDKAGQSDTYSKRVTKLPLNRKILTESTESECLMLPLEGSELTVTNTEEVGKSALDGISLSEAGQGLQCINKRSAVPSGEGQFVAVSCQHDGHKKSKPKKKSGSKQVFDGNVEKSTSDGTSSRQASKGLQCVNERSAELSGEGQFVALSYQNDGHKKSKPKNNSSKQVLDGNTEKSTLDAISSKKASKGLQYVNKRSAEPSEEGQFVVVSCQDNGQKRSKPKNKSCSKQVLDGNVEKSTVDGTSLIKASKGLQCVNKRSAEPSGEGQFVAVCCQHDGHKKLKAINKSCSKRVLDRNDEYSVSLSSFLQNKTKKRRLQVVESVDHTCFPSGLETSELVSKKVDQHHDEIKLSCLMQNGEAQTHYNNGCSGNIVSCGIPHHSDCVQTEATAKEPNMFDMVNCRADTFGEPMKELVSINHCNNFETDDITLASLLCNKQKNKGQVLARSGDVTLASILCNKQKKKGPFAKSASEASCHPCAKKRSRSQCKGVELCCNGRISENLSSREMQSSVIGSILATTGDKEEPGGLDLVSDPTISQQAMTESVIMNTESYVLEGNDNDGDSYPPGFGKPIYRNCPVTQSEAKV